MAISPEAARLHEQELNEALFQFYIKEIDALLSKGSRWVPLRAIGNGTSHIRFMQRFLDVYEAAGWQVRCFNNTLDFRGQEQ